MRTALLLLPALLLAGCAQLQDARDDAERALADAQRDAQEARDRYERVRSATVVRNETVDITITPRSDGATLWFAANVSRAGVAVPAENLSALPPLRLAAASFELACDPLACRLSTSEDVEATWADGAPGALALPGGQARCEPAGAASSACAYPTLRRGRGWALVTTAAGDVAD